MCDIESVLLDGKLYIYAMGYVMGNEKTKTYYITDYVNNNDGILSKNLIEGGKLIIRDFISYLDLLDKNLTIFAHNMGGFDGYFIMKELMGIKILKDILIDDQNYII